MCDPVASPSLSLTLTVILLQSLHHNIILWFLLARSLVVGINTQGYDFYRENPQCDDSCVWLTCVIIIYNIAVYMCVGCSFIKQLKGHNVARSREDTYSAL